MIDSDIDTYPIAVIEDRYQGTYSNGKWLAISCADYLENGAYRVVRCLEDGPHGDDTEAQMFWSDPPHWIASGDSLAKSHSAPSRLA
jgi:hypothetical protein